MNTKTQNSGDGIVHPSAKEVFWDNERQLRTIIDLVPHFIFAKDEEGRFILVNQAVANAYGTTVEKLEGATDADYASSEQEVRRFREDDAAVIRSNMTRLIPEERITDSTGQTRILSTTKIPFYLPESNRRAILGVSVDITDLKHAEDTLAIERNLYMDLVNSQPSGIYRLRISSQKPWAETEWVGKVETNYHLEMMSDRFCTILGASREQFEANASIVVDCIHPEDRNDFTQRNVVALATMRPFDWEGRILKQNQVHWVHFLSVARPIPNGDVIWTGIVLDISALKQAEETQRRAHILESLGIVAGGIAHDFNNLLAAIFGHIELAKLELPLDHPALASLNTAHQSMDNARRLTNRLLTFAKGGNPVFESIDLRQDIYDTVKFHLSGSNVVPKFDIPVDLWAIKADRSQIFELILNLTVNAKEAMLSGGTLHVQALNIHDYQNPTEPEAHGDYVQLVFKDSGTGISPNIMEKIFDPYFTTKQSGSGLGLAIVHGIVRKHKGIISVASIPGAGASFTICLPANRISATFEKNMLSPPVAVPDQSMRRILVMDDEPGIRNVMFHALARIGHTVETANDGKDAIDKYAAAMRNGTPFDLTIMDLTIPGGMGGKEAIQELLALDPSAKAIVSSGYFSDPVMSDYEVYGFAARLAKPFKVSELTDAISSALSNS